MITIGHLIKNTIILAAMVFGLTVALLPAATYAATNVTNNLKCGANFSDPNCSNPTAPTTPTVQSTLEKIINVFSMIVGAVAVIMLVFGGFRYVTSGGDSGNISSAKNTILYAIVGLVIVALAQAIVWFVLDNVVTTTATPTP